MKLTKSTLLLSSLCLLLLAASAHAAPVSGTVTDKTTGKPAAGDTVVLVEPMSGMSEVARTTTSAQGRYTLNLPGA
ncbi:MAG: carboxypeptidase regulatory-like domain-containing protein, partial [Candidatus Cybelea sp.]